MKPALALAAFSLLLAALPAAAQPAAAESPAPPKLPKISIAGPDPAYPREALSMGAQGTVELLITLDTDGKVTEAVMAKSSRSPLLDEAGLGVAKALQFKVPDKTKALPPLLQPIGFYRDTLQTLAAKTCQEFNVDVQYQLTTFPESKVEDMTTIKMMVGMLVVFETQRASGNALLDKIKKSNAASRGIADACAANPSAKLLPTFRQLMDK